MLRFFREFWRAINVKESEVRNHATVAGVVAFMLTLIESANKGSEQHLSRLELARWISEHVFLCLGSFCLGYLLIVATELLWVRKPIAIRIAGKVDGYWVYATRDMDAVGSNGGATMHITSMGYGFEIAGLSFEPPSQPGQSGHLRQKGRFRGEGLEWRDGRIHFSYEGTEHGEDDNGVGFYTFSGEPNSRCIEGRFTGSRLGRERKTITRSLAGRQVFRNDDKELAEKSPEEIQELLNAELYRELQKLPSHAGTSYRFRDAGEADGTWIDAIFEKRIEGGQQVWKLIEGSLIEIKSFSDLKQFELAGWTYTWEELQRAQDPEKVLHHFDFNGKGQPLSDFDGFYYNYKGFGGYHGSGVGYYIFASVSASGGETAEFNGAFLSCIPDGERVVHGRRVKLPPDRSGWRTQLKNHLDHCDKNRPAILREISRRFSHL
jgi:hypothetical protein